MPRTWILLSEHVARVEGIVPNPYNHVLGGFATT